MKSNHSFCPSLFWLGCAPVLAQDAPAPVANPEDVPNTYLSGKGMAT